MVQDELKDRILTAMDMEQRSATIAPITPLHISRMINVPVEMVEKVMKEMQIN